MAAGVLLSDAVRCAERVWAEGVRTPAEYVRAFLSETDADERARLGVLDDADVEAMFASVPGLRVAWERVSRGKRARSPSPAAERKRVRTEDGHGVLVLPAAAFADEARHAELVAQIRASLHLTGLVVVTDVLSDDDRAEVQRRLAHSFLDMFGHTASVGAAGNAARIEAALAEGRPADALRIAAQSRAARDGHGLVGFSHFRVQPAPKGEGLVVAAPGHPLDGVVFTRSPVYARVNKFVWSRVPGVLAALMAATDADFVSHDAGMCRYVAPRGGAPAACAAAPCATTLPTATKFHTDTYDRELHRTQGIYFERTEGALRLCFVPNSHERLPGTPMGFSARAGVLSAAEREGTLRRAIAAPDNSFVFFAQGVVHGEQLFDVDVRSSDGLLVRPLGPFGAGDKIAVPPGELAVRLVLGTHRATYTPALRAALEAMAEHGFIPESIAGVNTANPLVHTNMVNRYSTQYQKRFPPSTAASAAFRAACAACAAIGAAPAP